jgi:hypothetical protein
MTKKVTLPSGATVTLKDPSTLRVKDRKTIIKASEKGDGELSRALALGDAMVAILIDEWSFDLIIPSVQIESLDELTMADYDALVEHTKEAQKSLFPSLGDTDEARKDPKVPTAN